MKANDILTSSETNTDEAIALGIDISKTANYKEGQLTRLFAPDPLLLPITTLAFVQISQRSTLRLEMGMTLLSPLALSTRLIKLNNSSFGI
jgi:hypothetical protein